MPKSDYDDFEVSQYGNWNVAAEYSKLKIMKQLDLADQYETIATFGYLEFGDEFDSPIDTDTLKIKGFKRLVKSLMMVINNCQFAVKKESLKQLMEYKKELIRYFKVTSTLSRTKTDQRNGTKELVINEENYEKALERVVEIKALINEPLNRYDLIFSHKEEFDPKKWKAEKIKRLTTVG